MELKQEPTIEEQEIICETRGHVSDGNLYKDSQLKCIYCGTFYTNTAEAVLTKSDRLLNLFEPFGGSD